MTIPFSTNLNLTSHLDSLTDLRQQAVDFFRIGVLAANPYQAVQANLAIDHSTLCLGHLPSVRQGIWPAVYVIAFGKAACDMAKAASDCLGKYCVSGFVITNEDNLNPVAGMNVLGAGHPLPNLAGLHAAQSVIDFINTTTPDALLLVLISGGGSALLPYPVTSVSLSEKIATTQLLLASGATINEINCVRKHLSQLKGGGLARLAAPRAIHALILSDVLDDDISAIASGPTTPDNTTYADAIAILKNKALWHNVPKSVQQHLIAGMEGSVLETPKAGNPIFNNVGYHLIGSNRSSVDALKQAIAKQGYDVYVLDYGLQGEARSAARYWLTQVMQYVQLNKPFALISGGETTVTLHGTGKGGRNQELALAFALLARQQLPGNWVFLSGGTDGRDGPTDAAGGLVDTSTVLCFEKQSIDAQSFLDNNDSYHALQQINHLLVTGATGTNVADLQIMLFQPT